MTPSAPSGTCENGGCPRFATVVMEIPLLGTRHVCYFCNQALESLYGTPRDEATKRAWVKRQWRDRTIPSGAA